MHMGSILDVWRNLDAGFFPYNEKAKIPSTPGSYAWYFPLGILNSSKFSEFIEKLKIVFDYDYQQEQAPFRNSLKSEALWKQIIVSLEIGIKPLAGDKQVNNTPLSVIWEQIHSDKQQLLSFREALLKSSILLHPLYVGKAECLRSRYEDHMAGRGTTFRKCFERHMKSNGISCSFEELIFFALPLSNLPANTADLLEEILKMLSQPIFSKK